MNRHPSRIRVCGTWVCGTFFSFKHLLFLPCPCLTYRRLYQKAASVFPPQDAHPALLKARHRVEGIRLTVRTGGRRSRARGRRSEVGSRKKQRTKVKRYLTQRRKGPEVRGRRSEVGKSQDLTQRTGGRRSEVGKRPRDHHFLSRPLFFLYDQIP